MASTSIVWFRADLRVADHPALTAATEAGGVVCLFVVDPGILDRRHHRSPNRLRFLRDGLAALDRALGDRGSRLVVRNGDPTTIVPAIAREADARAVHITRPVSPLGRARDERVAAALADVGVELITHEGDLVVRPEELTGSGGNGYKVFTPFYRAWSTHALPAHVPAPKSITGPSLPTDGLDALPDGAPLMPAGPDAARDALVSFIRSGGADAYATARDALAEDGTSRLSPYLRFGMCTGAQVGRALGVPDGPPTGAREAFWRQIAWREFYQHLLWRYPQTARAAFQERYRTMRWDDDDEAFAAWTEGRTGYPIVDAGMRQLVATGWMHNRARMITASFLVKDLLIDWRRGETFFMQHLLDGDPANNNGGWQWTAGTGTDAAPYFRILNPIRQSERFDPDGAYIRRWVPELEDVPAKRIHEPWRMSEDEQFASHCRVGVDYPAPIVDHAQRRSIILDRYKETDPVT
jgi:deoxyribodipyrimidine photo-lyase